MPSSIEHCEVCPFQEVEPLTDNELPIIEDIIVLTQLHNLLGLGANIGVSPEARRQGIDAEHEFAAKSCAARIYGNRCPPHEFLLNPENGMYWLVDRENPISTLDM
jgi:hypothetical protein